MNDEEKLITDETQKSLEELKEAEIKNNPFQNVPSKQIEQALNILEEYAEEWF